MLKYSITLNLELFKCLLQLLIQSRSTGDQICTSPIMHLVCPNNIAKSSSSVSPGKTAIPRRNWKEVYAKLWGQTRCIMGDVQMANRPFYRYGGHIELISLTQYWDAQGAWAWSDILVRYLRSLFGSKQQKKKEAIKIVDTPKKLVWSFTVLFLT